MTDLAREVERVFVIADLSGYTALTEAHGNAHAANAVSRYHEITLAILELGARLVDRVGDEVLIATESGTSAVRMAIRLREAVEREPLFPTVRIGIHAGPVVEQDQRYFGSALNLASRVAAYARAGQILCTERITVLAPALEGAAYQLLGPVPFKNIVNLVPIFEIVAGQQGREVTVLDPVCRMQVSPNTAPARLPFAGHTYYFCSFDCARTFADRPKSYARAATG